MAEQEKPNAYLLVYSTRLGTRDEVKACLDRIPQIIKWRTDLPSSFYIQSSLESADTLSDLIVKGMGRKGRFILVRIGDGAQEVQGWMHPDAWHFINQNPNTSKK